MQLVHHLIFTKLRVHNVLYHFLILIYSMYQVAMGSCSILLLLLFQGKFILYFIVQLFHIPFQVPGLTKHSRLDSSPTFQLYVVWHVKLVNYRNIQVMTELLVCILVLVLPPYCSVYLLNVHYFSELYSYITSIGRQQYGNKSCRSVSI